MFSAGPFVSSSCVTKLANMITNKPILMQIGTCGPRRKGKKRSTSVVRRSKVKFTGGWSEIRRPGGGTILDPLRSVVRRSKV